AAGWLMRPRGAYLMGRNMFGPIRGAWEEDWRGWWGPEPPYAVPHPVGAAVAERLGPDSQAASAVAVSEAPGAERDHHGSTCLFRSPGRAFANVTRHGRVEASSRLKLFGASRNGSYPWAGRS